GKEIRESKASDRGRQCEREIYHGIYYAPAGKLITHQDPREQGAKYGVCNGCDQGCAKGQLVSCQRAVGGCEPPRILPGKTARAKDQPAKREEHQDAQIKKSETQRQAESGQSVE